MKTFLGPTVSKVETEKKRRERNHEDTDRGLLDADAAASGGLGRGSPGGSRSHLWGHRDSGVGRS